MYKKNRMYQGNIYVSVVILGVQNCNSIFLISKLLLYLWVNCGHSCAKHCRIVFYGYLCYYNANYYTNSNNKYGKRTRRLFGPPDIPRMRFCLISYQFFFMRCQGSSFVVTAKHSFTGYCGPCVLLMARNQGTVHLDFLRKSAG